MSFLETVAKARALLARNGRVSLRALRREFELDDEALEDLVEELVEILREERALAWERDPVHGSVAGGGDLAGTCVNARARNGPTTRSA